MISHTVEMKGFDKPLIDPKKIKKGLEDAAKSIKRQAEDTIRSNHHDTGQLERSLRIEDAGETSITIRFRGVRDLDKRKKKLTNAQVAFYLDKMRAALSMEKYKDKATASFAKAIK